MPIGVKPTLYFLVGPSVEFWLGWKMNECDAYIFSMLLLLFFEKWG
jgi:hypothetical protein